MMKKLQNSKVEMEGVKITISANILEKKLEAKENMKMWANKASALNKLNEIKNSREEFKTPQAKLDEIKTLEPTWRKAGVFKGVFSTTASIINQYKRQLQVEIDQQKKLISVPKHS